MAKEIIARGASKGELQLRRHLFSTQDYDDCNEGGNRVPKSLADRV
jgi:hypothetical protein